jgi:hypothetical protein
MDRRQTDGRGQGPPGSVPDEDGNVDPDHLLADPIFRNGTRSTDTHGLAHLAVIEKIKPFPN